MTSYPIPPNYADHILVASPSHVVRQRVLESLRSPVRRFEQASGGAEALVHLESGFWQVLFLDRRLPDLDAEELSQTVRQRFPGIEVVLLDPESDAAPVAAEEKDKRRFRKCGRAGHSKNDDSKNKDKSEAELPAAARAPQSILEAPLPGMIGNSRIMQPVYHLARLLAPRNTTVLITGPTGCGKEVVARAIHHLSPRAGRAFAVVNCAAIPGDPARSRTVRIRPRRFHRSHAILCGKNPGGAGRHALPRRNRRDAAEPAAQAAPFPGAERIAAPGQRRSRARGCPRRLRHQRAPAVPGARGKVPRRFVLPSFGLPHRDSAVARPDRRHSATGRALSRKICSRARPRRNCPPRRCNC